MLSHGSCSRASADCHNMNFMPGAHLLNLLLCQIGLCGLVVIPAYHTRQYELLCQDQWLGWAVSRRECLHVRPQATAVAYSLQMLVTALHRPEAADDQGASCCACWQARAEARRCASSQGEVTLCGQHRCRVVEFLEQAA
jgi:hypothetical protein